MLKRRNQKKSIDDNYHCAKNKNDGLIKSASNKKFHKNVVQISINLCYGSVM